MKKYLIFYLYGSLNAWGTSTFSSEIKEVSRKIRKSSILGFVASALGIPRNDENFFKDLQEKINFAFRIESRGKKIIDYHNTQVPAQAQLKNKAHHSRYDELKITYLETILSKREYYCDLWYTVILSTKNSNDSDAENLLERIKNALANPQYFLFLGRKCCPISLPIIPHLENYSSVEDAIIAYDKLKKSIQLRSILKRIKSLPEKHLYSDIDMDFKNKYDYEFIQLTRDYIINRKRWQYSEREEKIICLGE